MEYGFILYSYTQIHVTILRKYSIVHAGLIKFECLLKADSGSNEYIPLENIFSGFIKIINLPINVCFFVKNRQTFLRNYLRYNFNAFEVESDAVVPKLE